MRRHLVLPRVITIKDRLRSIWAAMDLPRLSSNGVLLHLARLRNSITVVVLRREGMRSQIHRAWATSLDSKLKWT